MKPMTKSKTIAKILDPRVTNLGSLGVALQAAARKEAKNG